MDEEVKQVSEFEKKEFVDLDNIAKLIDKAKEDTAEIVKKITTLLKIKIETL